METMDRKDSRKESIREKLKRASKPDTTWIKKAKKRAGLLEVGVTPTESKRKVSLKFI